MPSLDPELRCALQLARDCGAIALAYQTGGPEALQTADKPDDQGPVTRADTEINTKLVRALRAAFPGDAVVAEESAADAALATGVSRCWYIDPIDGTTEYAQGEPTWAIQIGLCIDGEPVLGVVHEAAARRLVWGVRTGDSAGAWISREGQSPEPLRPSARGMDALRLVSSKSHASAKIVDVMRALAIPPERNVRVGSTGVKMSYIARGDAELYVHPRRGTKLWDTCAPEAVIRAAGGEVSDVRGVRLVYDPTHLSNDFGVLASHGPHHAAIVAAIRPAVDAWLAAEA